MTKIDHDYALHLAETIECSMDDAQSSALHAMHLLERYDRNDEAYIVPNEILTAYLAERNVSVVRLDRMIVELLEVRTRIARIAEDTIRLDAVKSPW